MIQNTFSLGQKQSSHLFHILMECMEHRDSVSEVHALNLGCLHLQLPFSLFALSAVGWHGHSSCKSNDVISKIRLHKGVWAYLYIK